MAIIIVPDQINLVVFVQNNIFIIIFSCKSNISINIMKYLYEDLNQERNMRSVQNSSKQVCWWIFMLEDSGDRLFHWRTYYELCNSILARSNVLTLKHLDGFCFL